MGRVSRWIEVSKQLALEQNTAVRAINSNFKIATELIGMAYALVIAAGAGIGVDSVLPDFRGNAGFWNVDQALCR
jgi:hypothetical protein